MLATDLKHRHLCLEVVRRLHHDTNIAKVQHEQIHHDLATVHVLDRTVADLSPAHKLPKRVIVDTIEFDQSCVA